MGNQESGAVQRRHSLYSSPGGTPVTSRSGYGSRLISGETLSTGSFVSSPGRPGLRHEQRLAVELLDVVGLGAPPTAVDGLCRACCSVSGRGEAMRLFVRAAAEQADGGQGCQLLPASASSLQVTSMASQGGEDFEDSFETEADNWDSPAVQAEVGGRADFARPGGEAPRLVLKFGGVSRASSTCSKDTCPVLTLKVMLQGPRSDTLFGEARLPLDFPDLVGEAQERKVPVMRRGTNRGLMRLRISAIASKTAVKKLHSASNLKMAEVAKALAQVLAGEDGLRTMQEALHALQLADVDRASEQVTLQKLLRSLCTQAGMLAESLPDADVMERLARLAHSVTSYLASLLGPGAGAPGANDEEVEELAVRWFREIVKRLLQTCSLPEGTKISGERLRAFLRQGRKFPRLSDVVPIDRQGNRIPNWIHWFESSVPKSAILGGGVQGAVYRAVNVRTGDCYAVKDSPDRWNGEQPIDSRERELTDHILMAPHPCLVRLFGCFYEQRRTFIIMELCTRGDLAHIIEDAHGDAPGGQYQTPPEAGQWIGDIFLGLEHLHLSLQVLMRDLKPQNVVVNAEGRAKVTDYGHSRIGLEADGGFTLHPAPPGTPEYIAPEVALMQPYTYLSDLYSFGVLIWVLFTGGIDCYGAAPCEQPSRKDLPGTYKFLARNWQLLHRHVREPSAMRVLPLPSQQLSDLVLSLTQEQPHQRPPHERLRLDAYMRSLALPPMFATNREVENWSAPVQPPPPAG